MKTPPRQQPRTTAITRTRLRPRVLLACALAAALPARAAERVVTLAPHLAELVCAAAGCEALVAVGAYSDYPPAVKTLPVIGDVAQVNLEAVMALRPTRVIAWQGGTPAAQLAKLHAVKLPLTVLRTERLDDVATALIQLGQALGTPQRANAAASTYRTQLAAQRQRYAGAKPLRVLYQIETAPVYSINHQSPISEAITLCGGINVFADLPTLAAPVSDEAVLSAQPAVVIHSPEDTAAVQAYWARFAKAARVQPALVPIDGDLLARSGPRLVQGVQALCAALATVRGP